MDSPQYLEAEEKESLLPQLTRLANEAFGTFLPQEEVAERVLPVSTLLLAEHNGETFAFSTSSHYHFNDKRGEYALIYLVGTCIDPRFQQNGIYDVLSKERLKIETTKAGPVRTYIATRTQNPRVYGGIRKQLSRVHPNQEFLSAFDKVVEYSKKMDVVRLSSGCEPLDLFPEDPMENPYRHYFQIMETYNDLIEKSQSMAKILRCQVNNRGVVEGAYGRSKYESVPKYKDEAVNKMFERELNFERGDAFIIVGTL